jgi:DNA repair exonuclease SbcCD ATPase subunit
MTLITSRRKRREELAELESRLTELESELANLQSALRAFEGRYLSAVGERYDQLAEIEKEIAKLQGLEFDDEEPISLADDEVGCGQNRFHSDKLKKLYREVARKFHPDLSSCPQERQHRHQLMVEINRAYETGAEDRLQELLEAGEGLESVEIGGSMSAEMILLVRRIAEAKQNLAGIESEIEEITASEIYKLKLRVENAEAMGIDLFADLIAQVERQVTKARNRLEHLRGVTLTG